MFKRIVDVVEIVAAVCAAVFVVMLFVDEAPGTKVAATGSASPYASGSATTAPALNGAALFATNCSSCHGANGGGGIAPKLAGRMTARFPDKRVQVLVVEKGSGSMPPFENRLSEDEIEAVVDYTRSLR